VKDDLPFGIGHCVVCEVLLFWPGTCAVFMEIASPKRIDKWTLSSDLFSSQNKVFSCLALEGRGNPHG